MREIEALNLEIRQRHDVVMCQSVAALVTSFAKKIEISCQMENGGRFLQQLGEVGYLFQVESLLSTNGPEIGMLEGIPHPRNALEKNLELNKKYQNK